jgi:predicted nucleotidyltransferase
MVGIPLRTYKNYENDPSKRDSVKYRYILSSLESYAPIDEEHGVLTLDFIKKTVGDILKDYDVDYCLLFGSYSREEAHDSSDVDLLICTSLTGLDFFGLDEKLRRALHKKVDLLTLESLKNNEELTKNILRDGVKIYDKQKK